MTDAQVHHAIARATGDEIATIAARGFQLVQDDVPSEEDLPGQMIDWDGPLHH